MAVVEVAHIWQLKTNVSSMRDSQVNRETLNVKDIQEPPQHDFNFSMSL